MSLKSSDLKRLWSRSGNICSFPDCDTELAQVKMVNRVIGEEAHIKGERPGAPRYDPAQSSEERETTENRILLCPTHHTEIDSDPGTWTVERLKRMKADHELQVIRNRAFPELVKELTKIVERFQPTEDVLDLSISEISDPQSKKLIRVDASKEGGINTNIKVQPGQKLTFFARGLISYDSRWNFTTPEGILCNEYGMPKTFKDEKGNSNIAIMPHPDSYKTNGNQPGLIGSLIGWVGTYTEEGAFLIGSTREIQINETGFLHLMVNDAKGTYSDNDGEFFVEINIS